LGAAEVVVVGGGVAGCATALHLAARGHDVVVLDRGDYPREKPCGEGLMPHGVEELDQLGLLGEVSAWAPPITGIAYHAGGSSAVGRFPEHHGRQGGLGVRRWRLDEAFANACRRNARIDLRAGVRVTKVETAADGVRIETDAGVEQAAAVVGADGLGSIVRKQLGLGREHRHEPRYGARLHLRLPDGTPEPDVVHVHIARGVEFYVTPTGPREINLAVLCGKEATKGFAGDLQAGLRRLCEADRGAAAWLRGAEPLTEPRICGPLRQETTGLVADRAVLVGDAAGFVDAITGEGMSLAMASARMAADALSDGLRSGRLARSELGAYEVRRRAFARDLLALTELVLWWVRHPWLAGWVVRNLGRRPETFSRLLAVNAGQRGLLSIGPRDWLALATGL
jgi:2-polyprenyl-6-methoxyphenol hydroxylase-like FAD-dependent oxidoreductase